MTIASLARPALIKLSEKLIGALQVDSEILDHIHDNFPKFVRNHNILIHSFMEGRPMPVMSSKVSEPCVLIQLSAMGFMLTPS